MLLPTIEVTTSRHMDGGGLRIAMVQRFLPPYSRGGVGFCAHRLATELTRMGHHVTLFSMDPRPPDAPYGHVQVDVPIRITRLCRKVHGFALQLAYLDFSGYDVIHSHGDDWFLLRRSAPVLRTFHGSAIAEALNARGFRALVRYLSLYPFEYLSALLASRCVGVSRSTKKYLPFLNNFVPQGVDLSVFKPGDVKSDRPSILFVGGMDTRKRGNLLLKAFEEQVTKEIHNCELWLVCGSERRRVGEASRNIHWYSDIPDNELVRLYQRAWVFCLPSSYEGFGRPYIEALACGTPVVATPNPGSKEVLENGSYGLIAAPEELGNALVRILKDKSLRLSLRRRGLEYVDIFSLNRVARRYETLYAEISSRRASEGTIRGTK